MSILGIINSDPEIKNLVESAFQNKPGQNFIFLSDGRRNYGVSELCPAGIDNNKFFRPSNQC